MAFFDITPKNKIYKTLKNAEKAALRAKDLSNRLLTFSKGGAPIKETTSIANIIHDSVAFTLTGSNVKHKIIIQDDLMSVNVDKGQLSQVIQNIIINAKQSMPDGGFIFITCENKIIKENQIPSLQPGKYVTISIKDHGEGISEENLEKIFDPYFTTKTAGNGLGLATCYSIIKNHDGYIKVNSILNAGTTFTIYLPAYKKNIEPSEEMNENITTGEGRILVMDDENLIRNLLGNIFKRLGYEVDLVSDGLQAVELYKKSIEIGNKYTFVIMDLTIPGGMGGKETIEELLKIDSKIVAIASSGYSNDPVMANYQSYGFKGIIPKPYDITEIKKIFSLISRN